MPGARSRGWQLLFGAVALFVAWRVGLLVLDYLGLSLLPKNPDKCRKQWEVFGHSHYYWNGFFRWDAAWYGNIVRRGYTYAAGKPTNSAFYPVLPYAARALGQLFGGSYPVGGLVFVHGCALGATAALAALSRAVCPRVDPLKAPFLLLVFPTSFFLVSFFSEAPFLCFSSISLLAFVRRRYLWAGCFGALAMLTRSTGLVLAFAYAVDLAVSHGRRRELPGPSVLWLLLIPAALGLFMGLLWFQTGEPLAFVKAQGHWRPEAAWPWQPLVEAVRDFDWRFPRKAVNAQRVTEVGAALFMLSTGVVMAVKGWRPCYWVFVVVGTLLPLSTGSLMAMSRFCLVLFPAFLFWARVFQRHPNAERLYIYASVFLLAINSVRFMGCGWVG